MVNLEKIDTPTAISRIRCKPKALLELIGQHAYSQHNLKETIKLVTEAVKKCVNDQPKQAKQKRSSRQPTERNIWMGKCMKSEEKGGMGKKMSECSELWKEKRGV